MKPIVKGSGTTASERYLATLADRTFLNLWSYPSPYIDKKTGGSGKGKELCDLLVVCGDHVIIFSDKTIEWPKASDVNLCWTRWYKRAIKKSVDQVRGAERWIENFPNRIFIDEECTRQLPVALPPPDRRKVKGVVVALGAGSACREFFSEGTGSFLVRPSIRGSDHFNPTSPNYIPFAVGDIDPEGSFVHILEDATLDVLMRELDTVTDLADYFDKKAEFARSGHLLTAFGEEDLLAYYMQHMNAQSEHDFVHSSGREWRKDETISIGPGLYEGMLANSQYLAKKDADAVSYIWDELIQAFTNNIINGTLIVPESQDASIEQYELGVRYMALESRFQRRMHGQAILGVLESKRDEPRFVRGMIPGPTVPNRETAYIFMTMAFQPERVPNGDYELYRRARANLLYAYGLGTLGRNRFLKRVIAIGTEPPTPNGGSSEDMVFIEPVEWTEELEQEANDLCERFDILREDRIVHRNVHGVEYPEVLKRAELEIPVPSRPNRHQRRAMKAAERQRKT